MDTLASKCQHIIGHAKGYYVTDSDFLVYAGTSMPAKDMDTVFIYCPLCGEKNRFVKMKDEAGWWVGHAT